ncbi:MAG: Nif3-like dinuclear metal center hexameric protein [Oscillospiraceae bacterium]|jgi:dinuclear metal center YbgI/SA1388 family protein|nr:Nif3-like dinuclear metal center hexameric protein [Oscillospiraceae bacterium]
MPKINEVLEFLAEKAPLDTKLSFDNVGLLVGDGRREASRVLVALDITPWVIEEASEFGAELIVSHHPVIRVNPKNPLGSITPENVPEVFALAEQQMAAICMHTNLDAADEGVNSALAKACGITGKLTVIAADGIARVGDLAYPTTIREYLPKLREALYANGLRYYDAGREVCRVAVCGGSGGDYVDRSLMELYGFDTLITSDIKHGEWLAARKMGLNLIDGGHFCTENLIVPKLAEWISARFPQLVVQVSASHSQPVEFYM